MDRFPSHTWFHLIGLLTDLCKYVFYLLQFFYLLKVEKNETIGHLTYHMGLWLWCALSFINQLNCHHHYQTSYDLSIYL